MTWDVINVAGKVGVAVSVERNSRRVENALCLGASIAHQCDDKQNTCLGDEAVTLLIQFWCPAA